MDICVQIFCGILWYSLTLSHIKNPGDRSSVVSVPRQQSNSTLAGVV